MAIKYKSITQSERLIYTNDTNFNNGDGVNYIYLTSLQLGSKIQQASSTISSVEITVAGNLLTPLECKLCYVSSYALGLPVYTDLSIHTIAAGDYTIQYAVDTQVISQVVETNPLVLAVKRQHANSKIVVKYKYL
jgi:hypothetical protein